MKYSGGVNALHKLHNESLERIKQKIKEIEK